MSASLALAVGATNSHPYPLIRGGGLFLIGVGTGFLLAWIFPKWWIPLAVAGGVAGFTASGLSALLPSLGSPSVVQIIALVGALLVEMGLIAYVVVKYRDGDDRIFILSILFVVGLHFVIMGLAHGPLIAVLGVLTMINAAIGLRVPAVPLPAVGVVDALLKIGFGVWMLGFYPAFTFT